MATERRGLWRASGGGLAGDGFAQTFQQALQVRHALPEFSDLKVHMLPEISDLAIHAIVDVSQFSACGAGLAQDEARKG